MMSITTILLFCALHLDLVYSHTYHLGDCPAVEPVPNFDINRFLGRWYVVQKTSTGSTCLFNDYYKDVNGSGEYKIEQVSDHFLLGLTSYDHKYHYTGDLSIPDARNAGSMKVKFPLNVVGEATYTVFMTDYTNFAAVFTCQKLAFAHRQSASILSRTPKLDKMYIDKARSRLSTYGVDPHDLSIISQQNCSLPSEDTHNITISDETFSTGRVVEVVRKAGESIGDGIEAVGEGAKKLYHKVRGDERESKEDISNGGERDANRDAEWLP